MPMNAYIFVNIATNQIARVKAPTVDEAWNKYIDHFYKRERVRSIRGFRGYKELREELERDIFVGEDMGITEIG